VVGATSSGGFLVPRVTDASLASTDTGIELSDQTGVARAYLLTAVCSASVASKTSIFICLAREFNHARLPAAWYAQAGIFCG